MKPREILQEYGISLLGGALFGASLNLFVMPWGLYSGTFTGVAQVLEAIFVDQLGIPVPAHWNLTGILLLLMNIPLLFIAIHELSRSFFLKTVCTVLFQSFVMTALPVPTTPPIDNILTSSIIGGVIAGIGAGITLRAGGSGGGTDVVGIYCAKRYPSFSVGKISLLISGAVFCYCLWQYDVNIVAYSAIYTVIYAFSLDRIHTQNIKTSAMIFTKQPQVVDCILEQLGRGATYWEGYGAYTREPAYICMTAVSKYEVMRLKRVVKEQDPHAFMIFNDHLDVAGNFEKRL